jgi:hypothetical protein
MRAESKVVRVQKNQARGTLKEYRMRPLAQRAMQSRLFRVNDPGYRPGKVGTVDEFGKPTFWRGAADRLFRKWQRELSR